MKRALIIMRLAPYVAHERAVQPVLGDIAHVYCDARLAWINQLALPMPEVCGFVYEAQDIARLIQRHCPVKVEFLGGVCTRVLGRAGLAWVRMQNWMTKWGDLDE